MSRVRVAKPFVLILVGAVGATVPAVTQDPYWFDIFILTSIYIILATSLHLVFSTGQLSLAHPGLAAIGGYCSGTLCLKAGLSFWISLPVGGLAAVLASIIIGYPTLRLKGVYFFLVSLMFTELISAIIANFWVSTFGGVMGLLNIPRPPTLTIPSLGVINFNSEVAFYYLALLVMLMVVFILYRFEGSRFRMVFNSVRDNDLLAESVGVNLMKYKLVAFVVGGFFAGIAGGLYSHYQRLMTPYDFDLSSGILLIVYITVGGRDSMFGALVGAILLRLIGHPLRSFKEYQIMTLGFILILTVRFFPGGVMSLAQRVNLGSLWFWRRLKGCKSF